MHLNLHIHRRKNYHTRLIVLFLIFFDIAFAQTLVNRNEEFSKELTFTSKNDLLTKTQGSTVHQNIHCSIEDRFGNLWFGTTGEGVYKFDGNEFTQFTVKDGLSNNSIWSILEDASGNIWFGTEEGLCKYDGTTISTIPIDSENALYSSNNYDNNAIWSMLQDKNGTLWFGTSRDLYCYDGSFFKRFLDNDSILNIKNLKLNWIQCLLEDRDGNIWMGSGPFAMEGVILFDGRSLQSGKPNGDGWIRTIKEDEEGEIWFGGRNKGNFVFDGSDFSNYTEKSGIGNALLIDKSGEIWFSGEEKVGTNELQDGFWSLNDTVFVNHDAKNETIIYSIWSMLEDKNGNLWIGTRNCELFRYDGQKFDKFSAE